jgi:hypothetical protein
MPGAVLPAASVAEQFTDVEPIGNVDPEAGTHVTATDPSIASSAVTEKVTTAPLPLVAGTAMFAGSVRTGAVVSATLTVKLPEAVLLAASVAEQFTVVVPRANVAPEAGRQTTGTVPPIASSADAEKVTTAPLAPVAATVKFDGKVRAGAVESATVTVKLPDPTLPWASVAVQVTVVVPIGNADPDAGAQLMARAPSTTSDADAL